MAAAANLKITKAQHDHKGLSDFHEFIYGDRVTLQTPLPSENSYFRKYNYDDDWLLLKSFYRMTLKPLW